MLAYSIAEESLEILEHYSAEVHDRLLLQKLDVEAVVLFKGPAVLVGLGGQLGSLLDGGQVLLYIQLKHLVVCPAAAFPELLTK